MRAKVAVGRDRRLRAVKAARPWLGWPLAASLLGAMLVLAGCNVGSPASDRGAYLQLTSDLNPRYVAAFRELAEAGDDPVARSAAYTHWADLDAEYVERLRQIPFQPAGREAIAAVIELVVREEAALRRAAAQTDVAAMTAEMARVESLEPELTDALNRLRGALGLPSMGPAPSG